jgi:hypothetical protein
MADEALDLEEARANTQGSISEENVALETVPEAAPNGGSTLPAEAEHKIFTSISVDKVIILSFRGLQLRRIAEMQDNLLDMAVATAKEGEVTDEQRTKIDQALKGYGKLVSGLWRPHTLMIVTQQRMPCELTRPCR